ncbi:PAS domain-containing protein [Sulfurospirillum arcachonense]|uniref:PAS domain-containing protein n=1 Tax=Sulfurospirillum arcachonense TaxID=57666 RepID=UPI000468DE88|nr:PAS sensor domain-containing protein [Sulfurospirillum arcachonense]
MNTIDNENILDDSALLVSETDSKGKILYANDLFLELSEYTLEEMIGKPHNMIRHPDMPKQAFKDMWSTIQKGDVWEGFVKNKTKNDHFYWVYATVFPYGENHYLSVRKKAERDEIEKYEIIYKDMRQGESK